jgi:hypothetical protein
MPCIPSYHEQMWMQTETGFRVARQELERLIPLLEKSKKVVAETNSPEATEWLARADALLKEARAPFTEPSSPDTEAGVEEAARLADARRGLYQSVEAHVCTAGAIAWRAKEAAAPKQPEWKAVLTHHQRHREADRRAKLAELRRQLASLESSHRGALDAAREAIHARGDYFDDVTSREDAVREEAGAAAAGLDDARRNLEREIERIKNLTLDELCADRAVF